MKALMWHCKLYKVILVEKATRPKEIMVEDKRNEIEESARCIVSMITIEKEEDIINNAKKCAEEIKNFANDTGAENIVLMPFVHLSNNIAGSEEAIKTINLVEQNLNGYNTVKSHFGYHKALLMDVFGHPGNVRFREF